LLSETRFDRVHSQWLYFPAVERQQSFKIDTHVHLMDQDMGAANFVIRDGPLKGSIH